MSDVVPIPSAEAVSTPAGVSVASPRKQNLAWPDAERLTIAYLQSELQNLGDSQTQVTNRVPSGREVAGSLPLVVIRRAGGVRQGELFDRPRIAVDVWASSEERAADIMALVRDLLRNMVGLIGGFLVSNVSEFLGPTPAPDPDTQTPRHIMTVEALIRATAR